MPPTSPPSAAKLPKLAFVALTLVGLWAYWPTIQSVVSNWLRDPDYSHGFLVVPLSAWLVWRSWDRLRWAPRITGFHRGGILLLALAAVLRAISARVFLPEIDALTLPIWIGGLVWLVVGRYAFVVASPAIAFLWFAIPLPASIETALSTPLQLVAAEMSGTVLRSLGQPAVTEGATILLGKHAMEVERACSGLRMFYGIA
ncbi:MAG: exosortase/archaeosortase family protein [Planctomycetota bacterium]